MANFNRYVFDMHVSIIIHAKELCHKILPYIHTLYYPGQCRTVKHYDTDFKMTF